MSIAELGDKGPYFTKKTNNNPNIDCKYENHSQNKDLKIEHSTNCLHRVRMGPTRDLNYLSGLRVKLYRIPGDNSSQVSYILWCSISI